MGEFLHIGLNILEEDKEKILEKISYTLYKEEIEKQEEILLDGTKRTFFLLKKLELKKFEEYEKYLYINFSKVRFQNITFIQMRFGIQYELIFDYLDEEYNDEQMILRNRKYLIELISKLAKELNAFSGWISGEQKIRDESTKQLLKGKIPSDALKNNWIVFISNELVKNLDWNELQKKNIKEIPGWGIILFNWPWLEET